MARQQKDLLTPGEAAFVAGIPLRQVYKIARERLPRALRVRRGGAVFFKPAAAICFRIDRDLPKDVPLKVRRAFYSALEDEPRRTRIEQRAGALSYVLDATAAGAAVAGELGIYRDAMRLVRTDPEVQGGAATFIGTRILVHTIADLLKAGAPAEELKEDHPNLTDAMLAAAPIYQSSHPRRGRPRTPRWREGTAVTTRSFPRSMGAGRFSPSGPAGI